LFFGRVMNEPVAPPLPKAKVDRLDRRSRFLITLGVLGAVFGVAILVLRETEMIRPFSVPTSGMSPAVVPGDHIMMDGLTFLRREPRKGDIIVFATEGIPDLPQGSIYQKRVAGEPGENVRLADDKLFVNGTQVTLKNRFGEIAYILPPTMVRFAPNTNVTVPAGQYFVLGDNSTNSSDSRIWGCVPRTNVMGRVAFCYWPPKRVGMVR
jgi:signal peptidase I